MATFCNFHYKRRTQAKQAAIKMQQLIENTDTVGVDQLVIKELFEHLPRNDLAHKVWIRHRNVKTKQDLKEHNNCLVYHEKGTRGKEKGVKIEWADIETDIE